MSMKVNAAGSGYASARVAAGDVDKTTSWSFSAEDGNALLGPDGNDWASYSTCFLAIDDSATEKTKAYYKYPVCKGGKIYRSGVIAAKQRAAQQGDTAIETAAAALLEKIDSKAGAATERKRAWSTLEIKAADVNEEDRTFTGLASTPNTDRQDDIVEPLGAKFKLPMPFLWQHDSCDPIGWITSATATAKGITIVGQVADVPDAGPLKDRLLMAWQYLKAGLVRGLSIGFNPLEYVQIDGSWGYRFTSWDWLELSAVTIPANADCSINAIKSADAALSRAALGHLTRKTGVVRLADPPGASGITTGNKSVRGPLDAITNLPKEPSMKTIQERIAESEAKRASTVAAIKEMSDKYAENGETLSAEDKEKRATLKAELAAIDEHLVMLKEDEAMLKKSVVEIDPAKVNNVDTGAAVAGGVLSVARRLPKGTAFTRYAQALAISKGNLGQAAQIAKRWKDTPEVSSVLDMAASMGHTNMTKSSVNVGTTSDGAWAGPLVFYENMAAEFIDLLRPQTIIGKMGALRKMPFNVRVAGQTQGSTAGWVGEGAPKPVSSLGFNAVTLGHAKAAGIVVMTQELARFSSPSAESLVSSDLMKAIIQFLDQQFIDPSVLAVANVSPASITNGLTTSVVVSSGITLAQITNDVEALMKTFTDANLDPTTAVWVMRPGVALALSLKRTSQDVFTFPDIKISGGTWFGLPVITSNSVPTSVSGGSIIALVIQDEIFLADDGNVTLDVSQEASVQMQTAPSAGAQSLVSLWQNNLVGVRAEREINWQRRRDSAVGYIDQVAY